MKLLVGAALASWLLMAPPLDTGWQANFDPSTPLAKWSVVNTYETAQQCDLVRQWRIALAMRILNRSADLVKRARHRKLLIWDYLWECDRSDDPRLRSPQ